MPQELLIMRHAKSDWSAGLSDFDRPLNRRGREAALKMGQWLREQALIPDTVLASPAVRVEQTVRRVCPEIGFDPQAVQWERSIYEARVTTLIGLLQNVDNAVGRVLLIGHNPGLEDLLKYCCPGIAIPADGNLLPTATIAHLRLTGEWSMLAYGCAELLVLMRPKQLTAD